jgi:gliding motility-associated-like protein
VSATNNITYTGTAGASALYTWNFGGATVQSGTNAGPYAIRYASSGTKTVTLSVTENGCTAAPVTQNITVNEPPSTNFTLSANSVCSGAAVDVTYVTSPDAGASATWQWDGGTVSSGSGFGPFRVVYNQTTPTGIVLTVQDKDGVCVVSSMPKTVTVTQQPSAAFAADLLTGCPGPGGLQVQFTNQTGNTTPGTTTYLWDFGDGGTAAVADPAYTYTAAAPQTYQVRLTATTGSCTSVSPAQTITLLPKPKAGFVATPGIGVPVQLSQATFNFTNQSQDATLYRWDFGNTATSSLTNPIYTYTSVGDYTVKLIAANAIGCADTVQYGLFKVIPDSTLRIPNVFSPNGDGTHDTWVITGLQGYPTADVRVFNRWGQQVFGSKGYAAPWNGTAKGERLPVGTYYYVIVANNIRYAGWVMILR